MPFTADAWARNADAYETIRTMPFNEELAAGTLSRERFSHYVVQDGHYLVGFGRALAIAAAKAPRHDRIVQFCDAAKGAIVVERALHGGFMEAFGITGETFDSTPLSQGAHHYVNFLMATAYGEPYEVGLAALLPCFWIYAEVGKDIYGRAAPDNPYQAWIDTYAGEDFHESVRQMLSAVDEAAEKVAPHTIEAMHRAYTASTRLEWIFWDSAYRTETWPV